jgi:hypothetical protein
VTKKFVPIAALVIAALTLTAVATGSTHAKSMKFSAALNVGQERPHPSGTKVGAAGHFTATVTGTTIKWTLTFSHLTGPALAAHIHLAKRGVAGPVAVALCGPCTSPASGTGTVTAAQLASMKSGGTYVNVHTKKNGDGEIRGQITMAM